MRTFLTAGFALAGLLAAAPALADGPKAQGDEQAYEGCGFQAVTTASADEAQPSQAEAKARVSALIDGALAGRETAHVAQSPVVFPPEKPGS